MSTDLPAAIGEALDMPQPATDADHWLYDRILHDRLNAVRGAIDSVLGGSQPAYAAETLRRRIAQLPVTYRTWSPPEAREVPEEVGRR